MPNSKSEKNINYENYYKNDPIKYDYLKGNNNYNPSDNSFGANTEPYKYNYDYNKASPYSPSGNNVGAGGYPGDNNKPEPAAPD